MLRDAAMYRPDGLERQLKRKFGAEQPLLTVQSAGQQGACHVFVVSVSARVTPAKPFLFRNWKEAKTRNPLGTCEGRLWEAGRCTSAAPFYFPPYHHRESKQHLDDGGIYRNNPTGLALAEAQALWPGRRLGCIVSLGTGRPSLKAQQHSYGAKNSTWFRAKQYLGLGAAAVLPGAVAALVTKGKALAPAAQPALERAEVIIGMATESQETHLQVGALASALSSAPVRMCTRTAGAHPPRCLAHCTGAGAAEDGLPRQGRGQGGGGPVLPLRLRWRGGCGPGRCASLRCGAPYLSTSP